MKSFSKNQHGFSIVEVLVFVLLISILGGAFYYVSSQNKDDTKETAASVAGKSATTNKAPEKPAQTYNDPSGFSLEFPGDWKFVKKGTKTQDKETGTNEFTSNQILPLVDYPKSNLSHEVSFSSYVSSSTPAELAAQRFSDATGKSLIVNSQDSTMNGYTAHMVNYKDAVGEPSIYAVYVKHGSMIVQFDYSGDPQKSAYDSVHLKIINSVKFKH